jgi:four helix bundle protein
MSIRTFRDLIVWQRGMDLARAIYGATEKMPKAEFFGLTSQMRRAASSIPMNIAEGYGKHTRREFIRGLRTSVGSLFELMTAFEIATSLKLMPANNAVLELLAEEDRILGSLVLKLVAKEEREQGERRAKLKRGRKSSVTLPLSHSATSRSL